MLDSPQEGHDHDRETREHYQKEYTGANSLQPRRARTRHQPNEANGRRGQRQCEPDPYRYGFLPLDTPHRRPHFTD